jgi:hypothetical protein
LRVFFNHSDKLDTPQVTQNPIGDLPTERQKDTQTYLFDWDTPLKGPPACRAWVGDFFEEATAEISGAKRLKTNSKIRWCPDLKWQDVFFETKSVGESNQVIIYEGRLKKDIDNLAKRKAKFYYWIWRHRLQIKGLKTLKELRSNLAISVKSLLVVDFEVICDILKDRPVRPVLGKQSTKKGIRLGYGSNDYGSGWTLSLGYILERTQPLNHLVFPPKVYGFDIPTFEVQTTNPTDHLRFFN